LFPQVEQSIIFITFIGAFFPILINTISGVRNTPLKYINAGRSLGFNKFDRYKLVIIPSALPYIMTGLRVGLGVSWLGLIIAEMISGRNGIGYFTWLGYQLVDYTQIVTGIVLIGLLSMLTTFIITSVEKNVLKWQSFVNYG
jgi:NitT/TauT family transport system permease protein